MRADIVSTAANFGGFAFGSPLFTPYITFLVLLIIAAVVTSFVPETLVRQTTADATLAGEALAGLLLLGFLGLALAPVGIGVVTLVLPLTTALVTFRRPWLRSS
ncbi:hypothetical protein GCM10010464_72020 [Pseudonocardia yunnanensis]|uniref:DUF2232 domain-containing protein n=1 Tax=Pseudonocardia yunnanensis TaxID=58107 RepID=A0ABW4F6G7_9PSEU